MSIALPFLKAKQVSGAILSTKVRTPDSPQDGEDKGDSGLMSAAQDLVKAVQADDHKAAAEALRAAYQILDSEPHVEGEHITETSND